MMNRRSALSLISLAGAELFWGRDRSLRRQASEWYWGPQPGAAFDTTENQRAYIGRKYPSPAPVSRSLRKSCEVSEAKVQGQTVYTCTPRRGASGWHIVYTHGGSFVNALMAFHWDIIEALIEATGATVTVPIYPLAPEHHYTEALHQLEEVYRSLLPKVSPAQIILCGDASGGNLALSQALYYRERGLPLPGRILLFSPWLDVTLSSPALQGLDPNDVMRVDILRQEGLWWAGSTDPKAPLLSPIFGDLRGLPPIQVYQGTRDLFLPDARKLRALVTAQGGSLKYHETPGGAQVFMGATSSPEAKQVFQQIAKDFSAAP